MDEPEEQTGSFVHNHTALPAKHIDDETENGSGYDGCDRNQYCDTGTFHEQLPSSFPYEGLVEAFSQLLEECEF